MQPVNKATADSYLGVAACLAAALVCLLWLFGVVAAVVYLGAGLGALIGIGSAAVVVAFLLVCVLAARRANWPTKP